jgi:hypothetical protein
MTTNNKGQKDTAEDEALFRKWFLSKWPETTWHLELNYDDTLEVWLAAKDAYAAECILALHQEAEKMSREAAKMVFGALLALPTMDPDSKEFQALYKRLTGLPFKG